MIRHIRSSASADEPASLWHTIGVPGPPCPERTFRNAEKRWVGYRMLAARSASIVSAAANVCVRMGSTKNGSMGRVHAAWPGGRVSSRTAQRCTGVFDASVRREHLTSDSTRFCRVRSRTSGRRKRAQSHPAGIRRARGAGTGAPHDVYLHIGSCRVLCWFSALRASA